MNTLKEISKKIETFCDNHSAVEKYVCQDFSLFTSSDYQYPLMWATPINMVTTNGQLTFGIRIALMDTVYDKDLVKVLSDNAMTLTELLSWLDDDSENCKYYAVLQSSFEPFYRQVDNVCGWQGVINFNLAYAAETQDIRFK